MCCFPVDGSWLNTPSCQRPSANVPAAADTWRSGGPCFEAEPAGSCCQQESTNLPGRGGILAGHASGPERGTLSSAGWL